MTQITLNIPEDKVEFFYNYIKELDFVELEELKIIEEGKTKSKPIDDFLEELNKELFPMRKRNR